MCMNCYEEYGKPTIANAKTQYLASLIAQVFDLSETCGNAHVAIDDWNMEYHNIKFCLNQSQVSNLAGFTDDELEIERKCLLELLGATLAERVSALALYEGFLDVNL